MIINICQVQYYSQCFNVLIYLHLPVTLEGIQSLRLQPGLTKTSLSYIFRTRDLMQKMIYTRDGIDKKPSWDVEQQCRKLLLLPLGWKDKRRR
jgi:hypothetical protein